MANKTLTSLTGLTTPAAADSLYIVDASDTSESADGTSKKIAFSDLTSTLVTSPVTVTNGGTGRTSLTSGSVLVGAGTSQVSLYTTSGSGTVIPLLTSPVFVTPTLGAATATSINGLTLTSSTGVITITNGKTLAVTNTLTFSGTDSTVMTFPSTTDTVVTLTATQTLTNKTLTSPALQGTVDGWITSTDTWVYASASTFTISGVDRTAIYTKGTKLKFTNSSGKYAVVVSSSFSTNTTVTIAVNTDYVIANAAITAPQYSYADPPDYPERFNITASGYTSGGGAFTNNPTASAFWFTLVNKNLVLYTINLTYNGTSGGSGSTTVQGLPFTTATSRPGFGFGRSFTNGFAATVWSDTATTLLNFDKYDGTTAIANSANWVISCFQPI